jgi:FeS assembly SUF system protein
MSETPPPVTDEMLSVIEPKLTKQKVVDEFLSVNEPIDKPTPLTLESATDDLFCEVEGDANVARQVIAKLATVYDPEIPVNIYDLGLIYKIIIKPEQHVVIVMTLTAPGCPVAHLFPSMVEGAVTAAEDVDTAEVEIVWDPPWTQERMSEAARLELGMF